jgi:hypothetical protein
VKEDDDGVSLSRCHACGEDLALFSCDDRRRLNLPHQSLVPADLRDIGREVPSRPATDLGTRQGATEQQQQQARRAARVRAQPRKLDLFRPCREVEESRWTSRQTCCMTML